jgi:hypothetical protein
VEVLSESQRRQWAIDGYLHLPQVLTPDQVGFFSAEIDRLRAQPGWEPMAEPLGHYAWVDQCANQNPEGFMDRRDLLAYHDAFIALMDAAPVFDFIVDIMGPYLLLSMTQAIVRPSTPKFPGYTHTDGGEAFREIRVTESSRPLAMKVMYLLTDVDEPDSGNLTVFPGSHMRPFPVYADPPLNPGSPGSAQLMGKAGDCYLFPHALWHGPGPNLSGRARKCLLYNYCQMSVRWYDFEHVAEVTERCTPRQRRLLGDLGYDFRPGSYFYAPEDQLEVIRNGGADPSR